MASKTVNLSKRTFFILSGVSNTFGKSLAVEMCRLYSAGSVAVLIDSSEDSLQDVKKEILILDRDINVICFAPSTCKQDDSAYYRELVAATLEKYIAYNIDFELAFIVHNGGDGATHKLIEPQSPISWLSFVNENLYSTVALNRAFLAATHLSNTEKLVANITSSLTVRPFAYNSLICSCIKARNMYFRAMVNEERHNDVSVINYSPGILETHKSQLDENNNLIDLSDMDVKKQCFKLPRVSAEQSTLKLINILQEMSFVSGHDVDYYDTFVL